MGLSFEQISSGACAALIKGKARRFAILKQLQQNDLLDLEQDVTLHALLRAQQFDRRRGAAGAFLARVIDNKIRHIHDASHAQKRDLSRTQHESHFQHLSEPKGYRPMVVDLRLDVDSALASLPEPERRLAIALKDYRLADAARALGLSRTRSRTQLAHIRRHFLKHGMK